MPKPKTAKKTYKKIVSKGPLQNSKSLMMIKKVPFLGVKHWSRNMPYHEVIQMSSGSTPETASTFGLSLNGMFDPEVPVGGHQPMGFDAAMTFYEHYTITEASWTVSFNCATSSFLSDNYAVGYTVTSDSAGITGSDRIVENGLMKREIVSISSHSPHKNKTLSGKLDLAKFFGKKIITEDDYRGNATTNPVEQVYLQFFIHPLSVTTSVLFDVDFTMDFTALFTEPKKQIQS